MGLTLSLNLNGFNVSQDANDKGLTTISPDGLALTTGIYNDGLGVSSLAPSALQKDLGGLADATQNNLTTAELDDIHLVKGQTLTITYKYAFESVHKDFYAFAILGAGSNLSVLPLVDNKQVAANGSTGQTSYSQHFTISTTGNYDLFIGNASAGNNPSTDILTIRSVTITAPDGSYTTTPTGVKFNADGSQLLTNGDGVLSNGTILPNYLTDGSTRILAINTDIANGLIGQDGAGVIGHDGGGLITQDGGGLISQDGAGIFGPAIANLIAAGGGNLIAAGGGNLVAAGGGNLVAAGGGNLAAQNGTLIGQDGAGIISDNSAGLISNDGGGLISNDGGGVVVQNRESKSINFAASPILTLAAVNHIGSDVAIGVAAPGQQNDPQVADLANGNFVTVWSDSTSGHFIIRGQISTDVDASNTGSFFNISTDSSADQTTPSVAKLAKGGFVVAWLGSAPDGASVHTQLFDATGTKVGTEERVGDGLLNNTIKSDLKVVATPDGGFSTIFEVAPQGGSVPTFIIGQRYATDGTPTISFSAGDLSNGGVKSDTAAVVLTDGSIAVAYRDVTTASGLDGNEHDGVFLDIIGKDGTATKSEVQVDTSASGTQRSPAVAQLANGNIVVTWVDVGTSSGTGLATVRAQIMSENGTKVGGEYKIADTLSDSNASPVTVAALKDGTFSVIWTAPVVSNSVIVGSNLQGRIFTADGTGDGPIFNVNTPSADNSSHDGAPAATQLLNGSLLVVGSVATGANSTVTVDLIDVGATVVLPPPPPPGSTPPAPPVIFTPTKIGVEFAAGSGDLLALATGNFATVTGLQMQIYNPQGFTTGPAITLAGDGDVSSRSTVLSDGRIATAYNLNNAIYGVITNPDGTVSVPKFTIQSDANTSFYVDNITALTGGRFALIENSYNGGAGGVEGILQVVDGTGTTTVPSFLAFPDFGGNGANVNMAVLADGRLALLGHTNSNPEVAQIYSSDFTSHTTVSLAPDSNYSGASGDTTQTAVLDNGNFVHIFRPAVPNGGGRTDSTSVGLMGQIFKPDGTPVGAQFVLPGEHANPDQSQSGETVIALPGGGFMVAFSGNDGPTTGNSGSPRAVELQRYNDDGTTNGDLVVTSVDRGQNTNGHPKLAVLGDGNLALTFTVGPELAQIYSLTANTPSALTPTTFSKVSPDAPATFAPNAIAAAHFVTGDGNVDIVATSGSADFHSDNDFVILRGNGQGTLTALGNPISAPSPVDIKVADFNNDGHPDIVVARNTQGFPQVFLGVGDGTFTALATITKIKPGDGTLAVADLDGDGNQDIVTANGDVVNGEASISVLHGDGTGHFTETDYTAPLPAGFGTISINGVAIGDLNGDGRLDILGRTSAGIAPFLAQTNGTYVAGTMKIFNGLNAAVLADMNGDGKLDIVGANNLGAQILLGYGDGTFSDPQTIATGKNGNSLAAGVAVGDLNGDGKVDIVVANNRDATVTVLLGNGDGTFVKEDPIAVGNGPQAVTLADMDGDGRPDIVVTNSGDASVSVLLNTTVLQVAKIVQPAGAPPLTTPPVTDSNGHTVLSFIDAFGNTVALTTDSAGRLLTESVTASTGQVIETQTFTYNPDGSFSQHVEQATTSGSLFSDIGPAGEVTHPLLTIVDHADHFDALGRSDAAGDLRVSDNGTVVALTSASGPDALFDAASTSALIAGSHAFTAASLDARGNATTVLPIDHVVIQSVPGAQLAFTDANFTLGEDSAITALILDGGGLTGTASSHGNTIYSIETSANSVNTLIGGSGHDLLVGGIGADHLQGGLGNDFYAVYSSATQISDTGGTDVAFVYGVNYALTEGDGVDALIAMGTGLTATGHTATATTMVSSESSVSDVNTLIGGSGNDLLVGGIGADHLQGGGGNDIYAIFNSAAQINDSGGYDIVYAQGVNYQIAEGSGVDGLVVFGSGLTGTGSSGDDALFSVGSGNTLNGGSAGSDSFIFDTANTASDIVTGFQVHGAAGPADTIYLQHFADASFDAAVTNHHIFQAGNGNDVVITDGTHTIATLIGLQLAVLHANDFSLT